jgi:hypothetical protein
MILSIEIEGFIALAVWPFEVNEARTKSINMGRMLFNESNLTLLFEK